MRVAPGSEGQPQSIEVAARHEAADVEPIIAHIRAVLVHHAGRVEQGLTDALGLTVLDLLPPNHVDGLRGLQDRRSGFGRGCAAAGDIAVDGTDGVLARHLQHVEGNGPGLIRGDDTGLCHHAQEGGGSLGGELGRQSRAGQEPPQPFGTVVASDDCDRAQMSGGAAVIDQLNATGRAIGRERFVEGHGGKGEVDRRVLGRHECRCLDEM